MSPVLILGAGINGAALARELVLNGVPVRVVDTADICFGATAYSSRLIHGGLRYLEYGEFDLVRESLQERTRLLRLAPQFVRPLRLFIPLENRFSGILPATERFFGLPLHTSSVTTRGLWLVRMGLWLYEAYAHDPTIPRPAVHSVDEGGVPTVDDKRFRWLCSYYDAQIVAAERFVVALLDDARQIAAEKKISFELHTYAQATLDGREAQVRRAASLGDGATTQGESIERFEPAAVINCTGAWVDHTLARLEVPSPRLMGGTKGSHFITTHAGLRESLRGNGLYTEAADGRPIFILPFGESVLVGTTDIPFEEDPALAVPSEDELQYLVQAVNSVVPDVNLTRKDIGLYYCGVRPLPYVDARTPSSITRRHRLQEHENAAVTMFSVIGGKLTTCRSLAEEATRKILDKLRVSVTDNSQTRIVPGGEQYPENDAGVKSEQARLSQESGFSLQQVRAVWSLCGTRARSILEQVNSYTTTYPHDRESLSGSALPRGFVRWIVRNEWVKRLGDLVERRLLLHHHGQIEAQTLRELCEVLVQEGVLAESAVMKEIEACRARLEQHFGMRSGPAQPGE